MNHPRRFALRSLSALLLCAPAVLRAQNGAAAEPRESGGPLSPEQAAFDVLSYDLDIRIDPSKKSIGGTLKLEAQILHPTCSILLDLDEPFQVQAVRSFSSQPSPPSTRFDRTSRQVRAHLNSTQQPGARVRVEIDYSGVPREALRPPWLGGFLWKKDREGRPWIGVTCQVEGADLWWPCKDHPSDEPNRVDLRVTVPAPLVVASNGVLRTVTENPDKTLTYYWIISNPINTYNITVNAAYYRKIQGFHQSLYGELIPLELWVLPESYEKGLELFEEVGAHLSFLEDKLGPYPFRNEKYGVAETAYLGMEHQTIISYGNHFQRNRYGFDWLHLHELAHEWWGNLVSAADWKDYWIHEGFASYMEALYAESLGGPEALRNYMSQFRRRIRNADPLAPTESRTALQKYFVSPDYNQADGDVNFKGAWVLHSLRYLVGDQLFFRILREFLYPDPALERALDGSPCRFVATQDFIHLAQVLANRDLGWFFQVYLRQHELPRLVSSRKGDSLVFTWEVPGGLPFPMPLEVEVAGTDRRLSFSESLTASIIVDPADTVVVDPRGWILRGTVE